LKEKRNKKITLEQHENRIERGGQRKKKEKKKKKIKFSKVKKENKRTRTRSEREEEDGGVNEGGGRFLFFS